MLLAWLLTAGAQKTRLVSVGFMMKLQGLGFEFRVVSTHSKEGQGSKRRLQGHLQRY